MENVDEILVMDGGRIVERGNHYSLLAQDGLYRRLWDLQNKILFYEQALQNILHLTNLKVSFEKC